MPVNGISDLIKVDGQYWIVEIMEIKKVGINTTWEQENIINLQDEISKMEDEFLVQKYVKENLVPEKILTKTNLYSLLISSYWNWMNDGELSVYIYGDFLNSDNELLVNLKANYQTGIIHFETGEISLGEVAELLPFQNLKQNYKYERDIKIDMDKLLNRFTSDYFVMKNAEDLGMDSTEAILEHLSLWQEKLVFEAYLEKVKSKYASDEELFEYLEKLKKKSRVAINYNILDKIDVDKAPKLNFDATKFPVPTVDEMWLK